MDTNKAAKFLVQAEAKANEFAERMKHARESDPEFDTKLQLATGLVLCFLGGQVQTTFAFVEAFQQAGFPSVVEHVNVLKQQVLQANEAWQKDDLKDDNKDGVADVKQMGSQRELLQRKLQVVFSAMDPETVKRALKALMVCFMAAVSAVQLKMARVVSLAVLLGDFIRKHVVERYLVETIRANLQPEFHKWIPLANEVVCRLVAGMLAYRLTSFLFMVSSAVAGGEMVLKSVNQLCANRNVEFLTQGKGDEVMTMGLVGLGIVGQTLAGSTTKAMFKIVFFPVALTELLLKWIVVLKVNP